MRKIFIIISAIFIAVFSQITFVSCEYIPMQSVPDKYKFYLSTYNPETNGYNTSVQAIKDKQKLLDSYRECLEQQKRLKPKVEIVRVLRANSSFVMNSPASFNRDISNNTIKENGHGADEEDIYMLYLSDGKIIKASPRDKSQWLGTKVGEKVRKVTSLQPRQHNNAFSLDTIVDYQPLYE